MKIIGFCILSCLMIRAEDASVLIYKIRMSSEHFQQASQGASQEELFQRCQKMTEDKAANLMDIGFLRGQLGVKISMQSQFELLYPCEQEMTGIPNSIPPSPQPKDVIDQFWFGMNYTPSPFKPRYVGKCSEMEISKVDDHRISVRIEIENVEYLRDDVLLRHKNFMGNLIEIKNPRFFSNVVSRSYRTQSGKPILISAANTMKTDGSRDPKNYDVVFVVTTVYP